MCSQNSLRALAAGGAGKRMRITESCGVVYDMYEYIQPGGQQIKGNHVHDENDHKLHTPTSYAHILPPHHIGL